MPRYPIREARELVDKVLVAPRQRRWLEADLERVVTGVRVQVGERAQAVAGNCCPGRAEPRSDGWTSSPGPQDLLKRVQNHGIDLPMSWRGAPSYDGTWTICRARCAG